MHLLSHPNIIRYYNMWTDNKLCYIVLECGIDNLYCLRDNFDDNTAKYVLLSITSGLEYLHSKQRIVHLDIKPDNIIVMNNRDIIIKLSDFGISQYIDQLISDKKLKIEEGDSKYLCLEIFEGKKAIKDFTKIDIFAAGVTMYELINSIKLSGNGANWKKIRNGQLMFPQNIDPVLKFVVTNMLSADADERLDANRINRLCQ